MPKERSFKREILRAALGPGKECPPLEELVRAMAEHPQPVAGGLRHVESCPYCQAEFRLWKAFEAPAETQDNEDVLKVTARLDARMAGMFRHPESSITSGVRPRWWNQVFTVRWLAPTALALSGLLLAAGIVVEYRQARPVPVLGGMDQAGGEVLRSISLTIIRPTGDVQERPSEIKWVPLHGAAKYVVKLVEVDGAQIWKTETAEDHVELPPAVRARIVPAKTIFCEITAFDSSGSKVGETGLVRFRLLLHAEKR